MQLTIKPVFRKLALSDIPQILRIERMSFPDPWSLDSFRGVLQVNTYVALGAFDTDLLGYIITNKVLDELHILNIAVNESSRRKGVANALIAEIMRMYQGSLKYVDLEVRENNYPAIEFYKKLGFKTEGLRKNYYPDGSDALLMTLFL